MALAIDQRIAPARAMAWAPLSGQTVPEPRASRGHQLRLWARARPSGGLMHQLGLSARGLPSAQVIDQLRLWGGAQPIGAAFMISLADGPGAAHRGRLSDQLSLWEGGRPISPAYTSTPVLLCPYAHRRMLVRLYYSTPVLLRTIISPTGGNRARG